MSVETFRRHVRAAAGIQGRIHRGELTGRNSASTDQALEHHIKTAAAILAADAAADTSPLCDYLDSPRGQKLAAAWNRIERRHVGLYV